MILTLGMISLMTLMTDMIMPKPELGSTRTIMTRQRRDMRMGMTVTVTLMEVVGAMGTRMGI